MKQKSLPSLKKKAWKLLSEHLRKGQADSSGNCRCVTCGVVKPWKEMHAGHAIPGRKASVLFDIEIIYPQCPVCNIWKGGCYGEFAAFLIRKHGLEWYENKQLNSRKPMKLTRADVQDLIERFS